MTNRSTDLAIRQETLSSLLNRPGQYAEIPPELQGLVERSLIDYISEPDVIYERQSFVQMPAKRAAFKECVFRRCDFSEIGAASSSWEESEFSGCQFRNANFQYARLTEANFLPRNDACPEPNVLSEANFSAATLHRAVLSDVQMIGSSFGLVDFSRSTMSNCRVMASSLEGASFVGATLSDVDFRANNLEYCDFSGAICRETRVSLLQLPYLFGVDLAGIGQPDGLIVASSSHEGQRAEDMEAGQIMSLLPSLERMLHSRKDFFPLANLSLMRGKDDVFHQALSDGLKKAIYLSDYRSIRYYAKLAKASGLYEKKQLEELFNLIRTSAEYCADDPAALNDYKINEGAIRQTLLPSEDRAGLALQFTAHAKPGVFGVSAHILSALEDCFHELGLDLVWHNLQITRNSPETFILDIIDLRVRDVHGDIHIHHHYPELREQIDKAEPWQRLQAVSAICSAIFGGVAALAAVGALALQFATALQSPAAQKTVEKATRRVERYVESVDARAYHNGILVFEAKDGRSWLNLEAITPPGRKALKDV